MDCYCDKSKGEKGKATVKCLICNSEVHKECYKIDQSLKQAFYCEICILKMVDPLISNELSIEIREFRSNTVGLLNFYIILTKEAFDQILRGKLLNIYIT